MKIDDTSKIDNTSYDETYFYIYCTAEYAKYKLMATTKKSDDI